MADVWDFGPDDAVQVSVFVCLANFANDKGSNCFPGTALIARMTRYSERTVIRAIDGLERDGWITVIQRGGGRPKKGSDSSNKSGYQINLTRLKGCQPVSVSNDTKRVTLTQKHVTLTTEKGDSDDNPPDPLLGGTIIEPPMIQIPPNPPQAGGGVKCVLILASRPGTEKPGIDAAVENVMRECGFTARRLRLKIRAVVVQVIEREDGRTDTARQFEFPEEIAAAMIDAWQRYTKQGLRLKAHMSAAKFFGEGYWMNSNSWHWDNEMIREERQTAQASVGSWR